MKNFLNIFHVHGSINRVAKIPIKTSMSTAQHLALLAGFLRLAWSESTLGANMTGCAFPGVEVAKYSPRLQDTVVHSPPALTKVIVQLQKLRSGKKEGETRVQQSHTFPDLAACVACFPFPTAPTS